MPNDLTKTELENLTPKQYLRQGYCNGAGEPRDEILGTYATAACMQLEKMQTSPQELQGTHEAFQQALPWHQDEGDPQERMRNTVEEALENAASLYEQQNNVGIVSWLNQCVDAVHSESDASAFMAHFTSVVRQYSVITKMRML